jgi:hypothetical protein
MKKKSQQDDMSTHVRLGIRESRLMKKLKAATGRTLLHISNTAIGEYCRNELEIIERHNQQKRQISRKG